MIDWSKPIDTALYSLYLALAKWLWGGERVSLGMGLVFQDVYTWLTENFTDFVVTFILPFRMFLVISLLLAVALYGLSRVLSVFIPQWQPVDLGKAFLYGVLGFFYFSSASLLITSIEDIRLELGEQMQDLARSEFTFSLANVSSSEAVVLGSVSNIDGRDGTSGIDIAATYVGAKNKDDLARTLPSGLATEYPHRPATMPDCCFPYSPTEFQSLEEADRALAIDAAQHGITILLASYFLIPHAITGDAVWLLLTLAALSVFLSLPFGFVFAPFRSTQGLLVKYVNQYVEALKETVLTAIFLAAAESLLMSATFLSDAVLIPASLIAFMISLWRGVSAMKLLASSISGTLAGASAGSAVTIEQGVKGAAGIAVGAGIATAGVATGNALLAAHGAKSAWGSMRGAARGGAISPWLMAKGAYQGEKNRKNQGGGNGGGYRGNRGDDDTALHASSSTEAPTNADETTTDAGANDSSGTNLPQVSGQTTSPNGMPQTPVRERVAQISKQAAYTSEAETRKRRADEKAQQHGAAGERIKAIASQPNGSQEVRNAAEWMGGYIDKLGDDGKPPEEINRFFRRGAAYSAALNWLDDDSPFRDRGNFDALADIVVNPSQTVGFTDIVTAVAHSPSGPMHSPVEGAAIELGLAGDFGPHNGMVASIANASERIGAGQNIPHSDESYLERSVALINDENRAEAADLLGQITADETQANDLLDRLEVGAKVIQPEEMAQSISYEPGNRRQYKQSYINRPQQAAQQSQTPSQSQATSWNQAPENTPSKPRPAGTNVPTGSRLSGVSQK
ncbi:MAG: hypothetical protein GY803_10245 [Chloroflexi bacterium]|nr:hypothetical protein [Chloroflexota bacterium]